MTERLGAAAQVTAQFSLPLWIGLLFAFAFSGTLGLLELLLVFGVVLGLAIRELIVLRRDSRASGSPSAETSPQSGGGPPHPER